VLDLAKSNLIFKLAFHHKLSHLYNGYMSRDSLWDKIAFSSSRSRALGKVGGKLRAVIITSLYLRSSYTYGVEVVDRSVGK
jgi:long-chain acyl-CoA synthetase